jgi:hypothetical protein
VVQAQAGERGGDQAQQAVLAAEDAFAAGDVDEERVGLVSFFDTAGVHPDHGRETHAPAGEALEGDAVTVGVSVREDRVFQEGPRVGHGHAGSHSGTP